MVETLAQKRGLIATFMAKPFAHLTGSGAHFHFSLWRDGENAFARDAAKTHAAWACLSSPTSSSAGSRPMRRLTSRSPRRPSTPTSASSSAHPTAARPGRRHTSATAITTEPRCCAFPRPDGSKTAPSTAPATRTSPPPRCWAPDSTGSSDSWTWGARLGQLYELSQAERSAQGIELLPANLLDATRELERNEVLRAAFGKTRGGDYATTSSKSSAESGDKRTSRSPAGNSTTTSNCSQPDRRPYLISRCLHAVSDRAFEFDRLWHGSFVVTLSSTLHAYRPLLQRNPIYLTSHLRSRRSRLRASGTPALLSAARHHEVR